MWVRVLQGAIGAIGGIGAIGAIGGIGGIWYLVSVSIGGIEV